MGWWSGSGDEMMVKSAARQVEQDIEKVRVELDAVAKKSKMKPVQTTNLSVSIREGSGRTVKLLKRSGRRRQRK
jgi:DNA mismatch repair protein MutH